MSLYIYINDRLLNGNNMTLTIIVYIFRNRETKKR